MRLSAGWVVIILLLLVAGTGGLALLGALTDHNGLFDLGSKGFQTALGATIGAVVAQITPGSSDSAS